MNKIFTLIAAAFMVASVNAQESVILQYPDGEDNANLLTLEGGYTLQITANVEKSLSSGMDITVDGTTYKTLKLSNGAQNTLTLPAGMVASEITLYSYVNHNETKREDSKGGTKDQSGHGYRFCYWKEVAGTNYTADTAVQFRTFIDGFRQDDNSVVLDDTALQNPDAQTFPLNNLNSITFTNTGEQVCFVIGLKVMSETAGIEGVETDATIDVNAPVYNIAGQQVTKSYKGIVIKNGKKYIQK